MTDIVPFTLFIFCCKTLFYKCYHYDRIVLSKWKYKPDFNKRKTKIAFYENVDNYFGRLCQPEILTKSFC